MGTLYFRFFLLGFDRKFISVSGCGRRGARGFFMIRSGRRKDRIIRRERGEGFSRECKVEGRVGKRRYSR